MIVELYEKLKKLNIQLEVNDGKLEIKAPKGIVTQEIVNEITQNKQQFIEFVSSYKSKKKEYNTIPQAASQPAYPLSSAQQRLWLLSQLGHGNVAYNMPGVYELEGKLDVAALERALISLITRHEILRTGFKEDNGDVQQHIKQAHEIGFKMAYCDVRSLPDKAEEVKRLIAEHTMQPFDLQVAPLLRAYLFQTEDEKYVFAYVMHHIVSDGWSMQVMLRELFQLYQAHEKGMEDPLPPLRIHYKDYTMWRRDHARVQGSKEYWLDQFSGGLPILLMPEDKTRLAVKTYNGALVSNSLDVATTAGLQALGRELEITTFMSLLGLVNTLLYRYTGQNDIIIGSPIAGRDHIDLEDQIGFYVNTLALRTRFQENDSYRTLASTIKKITSEAYNHQSFSFDELVDELHLQRDMSRSALFDVMVSLQTMNVETATAPFQNTGNLSIKEYDGKDHIVSKFDLSFIFAESATGLNYLIEYNTDLYNRETIENLSKHFGQLVKAVLANTNAGLKDLSFLSAGEQKQITEDFNNTAAFYPDNKTLIDLFREQADKTPDHPALELSDKKISYRSLNETSNQLAAYLKNTRQVKLGDLVCIRSGRSQWLITAVFAVLKCGAAYVPVDVNSPQERVDYIVKDSGSKLIIDQDEINRFIHVAGEYSPEGFNVALQPEDLAYVIYTSGTTGQPKGVMVEHRGLVCRMFAEKELLNLHDINTCLITNSVFDVSLLEIFLPLLFGGKITIPGNEDVNFGEEFIKLLINTGVTILQGTPSFFINLLASLESVSPAIYQQLKLKQLCIGGESLPLTLASKLKEKLQHITINNHYGPTETIVDAIVLKGVATLKKNSIGSPIANTQVYIINSHNGLQPVGVVGQICIAGHGLARGYLNQPELTAEKFVNDPFNPGGRMYKTGDLGKWCADGTIEFIGRNDSQVKIRGYRIELGEIEDVFRQLPRVQDVAVITHGENTEKELIAYIVSKEKLNVTELRAMLGKTLPAYMIPSYFVQVNELPLNANGKIEKNALPLPSDFGMESGVKYEAPGNETERTLVKIWSGILGIPQDKIGINDNFFELGGHSLKMTRLSSQMHKAFNVRVELKDLFVNTVLKEQSLLIQKNQQTAYTPILPLQAQEDYTLSSSQRRLWILSQFKEGNVAYNIPGVYVFKTALNAELLSKSFDALIARHEILRTVFVQNNNDVRQKILGKEEHGFKLTYEDLRNTANREEYIRAKISEDFSTPFTLASGPLMRAALYQAEDSKWVFSYVMQHIISDGWSMDILFKELLEIYTSYTKGEPVTLPPLSIQYKDYAAWQQSQLQDEALQGHKNYWLRQFEGEIPVLELPTDRSRPAIKTYSGNTVSRRIGPQLSANLKRVLKEEGATLFMGFLSSVNALLYRYTNQSDIVIGSPIAGREHADLDNQIGVYINMLALRTQFDGSHSYRSLLRNIKKVTLDGYAHQMYPFDELIDQLSLKRDMSRSALFDVMITLQNSSDNRLAPVEENSFDNLPAHSKFDLSFDLADLNDDLQLTITYSNSLYDHETVVRMCSHLASLLDEAITHPDLAIMDINYMSKEECDELLETFNATSADYPRDKTLVNLFEEQVAKNPGAIALVVEEKEFTFSELNAKANQLGNYLRHTYKIQPDDLVGVKLNRGLEMIVSILGILKSGGAYVPIDPDYPQERIDYITQDSNCKVVIDDSEYSLFLKNELQQTVDLIPVNKPDDLVYVIYTSGSTGQPKGCMLQHAGVINLLEWMWQHYKFNKHDVFLQKTTFTFDVSVLELFLPLCWGVKMILCQKSDIASPARIVELINKNKVTTICFVPSMLNEFITHVNQEEHARIGLQSITKIFATGEALPQSIVKAWYKNTTVHMHNLYGPTEASVDVTYYRTTPNDERIPIGRPMSNTQMYILSPSNKLQPIGVVGEVCISGDGLARGYLNKKELTAEKFVANPYKPGYKMYKTGDLGKWLPDGNIECLGRKDDQVKIRGHRIELGEVETTIGKVEGVSAVIVSTVGEGIEKELVAYIVGKETLNITELKQSLINSLPSYMIPAYYVQLESLPLNSSGKADRKALPHPGGLQMRAGVEYIAPRNKTEEKLVLIWSDVLAIDKSRIGIKDSFFDLGGNSLKAIRIISRINTEFSVNIELKNLFIIPTIENLFNYIETVTWINTETETGNNNEELIF